MKKPFLPPDDLPPAQPTGVDGRLRQQLDEATGTLFYEACDPDTKALLSSCEWYITTHARALTLAIACPDRETNWRVLHHVVPLATLLEQFSSTAKIRVYPPVGLGTPFEIRVDERSVYEGKDKG
ncbi:MAG TPA: hypothetical protein DDZ80_32930 [Cyanobacteria bacterium UBA8803]|nr:hypothetical protein [Cyanobacteria bacterium UBA9273]HBL63000.1 hypothetical protein [Cyanobacteria bacterium UBA8803]